MNKFTKASIATGAGIVLLLGGGGTLAYWNAEAGAGAGTINAGTLGITAGAAGTWTDANGDAIADITNYLVVPGDTVTFTRTFTVDATGENLKADLSVDTSSIVAGDWDDELTTTAVYSVDGGTTSITQITDDNDGDTLTVSVTIAFAFDGDVANNTPIAEDDVNNDSQGDSVNLSNLKVVLTQVQP
jgi:alternate signal-mediated exported protein